MVAHLCVPELRFIDLRLREAPARTSEFVKGSRTPAAATKLPRGFAAGVGEASGEERHFGKWGRPSAVRYIADISGYYGGRSPHERADEAGDVGLFPEDAVVALAEDVGFDDLAGGKRTRVDKHPVCSSDFSHHPA